MPRRRASSRALRDGVAAVQSGERDPRRIEAIVRDAIDAVPELKIDYVEVRGADSLDAIDHIAGPLLLAAAVCLRHVAPHRQRADHRGRR